MRQLFAELRQAWAEGRYLDAAELALKMGMSTTAMLRLFMGGATVGATPDELPTEEEVNEFRAALAAPAPATVGAAPGITPTEIIAIVTAVFDIVSRIRALRKQQA